MSFPVAVSSGDKTRLRLSGVWSRTFTCINDNEVIFRARAARDYTDETILNIEYDSADIGSYADVVPGMVVLISPTTDPRDAIYRGRVADDLTGSVLPIDQNVTIITEGDYLIVICDVEPSARVRVRDLKDGRFAWTDLEPMIGGLPGCIVLYDSDDDGDVTYTPSQTGIAIADGASISSWEWTISGGGTSSISSASATHPLLTFEAGFHYLVNVVVTDSNGTTHRQFCHLYAVTRTFDSPVVLPVAAGSITSDLENGFNASIVAYGGVSSLIDRSHCCIFKVQRFGDNSSAPILTNLRFSGRLRSETITTEGSAEAGRLMTVSFEAEGITSYMQRLSVPNDMVRNVASPSVWGEIDTPDICRMMVYFLSLYTTLLSLGSFTTGDNHLSQWVYGGESVSIDGGTALDVLKNLCERISAGINFTPDGSFHIEQLASYKEDRSGIETIMDFTLSDMLSYQLERDTSRQTGQVIAYGGVFQTTNSRFVYYTALAPTIPYSDSPEVRELNRALLTIDSTTTEADDELKARAGNETAYHNSKPLLRLVMYDSYNWLFPTSHQRYTATIPASSNTRGIAYGTADFWQLQSVTLNINTDGTDDVTAELVAETSLTDAQSIASQQPINIGQMNPALPILSDDPAFPDNSNWMFPTDTPSQDELPPIDPLSGYTGYSPFSPDQAAKAAAKQGTPNCKTWQVLARNSGTTLSPFLTINTQAYTLKIQGDTQISAGWLYTLNSATLPAWVTLPLGGTLTGQTVQSTLESLFPPRLDWTINLEITFPSLQDLIGFTVKQTSGVVVGATVVNRFYAYYDSGMSLIGGGTLPIQDGAWTAGDNTAVSGVKTIVIQYIFDDPPATQSIWSEITIAGSGATNPFTGTAAGNIRADWLFYYPVDGDETAAQLFDPTAGGLLAGTKPSPIPAYSPSHSYEFPYVGDGNAVQAAYALASYAGVLNRAFTLTLCKNP